MKKIIYIPVKNKKIKLFYRPDLRHRGIVWVKCEEAGINQPLPLKDLGALIESIPSMVEEKKEKTKRESFVKIRVTQEEKEKLIKISKEKGFSSISGYIRNVALN